MQDSPKQEASDFSEACLRYRDQLLILAKRNLNPVLSRRISPDDLVQDALTSACSRLEFFQNNPEIPIYIKLRTILLQTISNCERKHLQSHKRDAYRDAEFDAPSGQDQSAAQINWNLFADSITSPLSRMTRQNRYELLRNILDSLPENDKQIITLRYFDGMSNAECADVLEIAPKAASIRHVRALQRLKNKLTELSEFQS